MSDRMTPEQFSWSLAQLAKAEHTGNYAQSIASRSALALHDKELRSELAAALEALAVLRGRLAEAHLTVAELVEEAKDAEAENVSLKEALREARAWINGNVIYEPGAKTVIGWLDAALASSEGDSDARGCAACAGDPEAHDLHVCGREPNDR